MRLTTTMRRAAGTARLRDERRRLRLAAMLDRCRHRADRPDAAALAYYLRIGTVPRSLWAE